MTPEEEFAILRKTSIEVATAVDNAYKELIRLIRNGEVPRDAVQSVMDAFTGDYAKIMAAGLSVVIGESIGSASALAYNVGPITLSARLYAQSEATASVVQGVVNNHVRGFQDTRALALELYEGYGFNPEEVLNIDKSNPRLPKYMREALLEDGSTAQGLKRGFARAQTRALRTGALRASYTELLTAIDNVEAGAGLDYLEKKLDVAFNERMRYYAKRIAETELHRAFAERQARELMADTDVEYVQWRLNPAHPIDDICDYFAGVDLYGLGPGVYPKELAPVAPAHPHCKCVLSPRLDIFDAKPEDVSDADQRYFNSLPPDLQRKVAGSAKKLERVKGGESAWAVHNAGIDPIYQVKKVTDIN